MDISGNRLDAKDLTLFIEGIHRKNFLKWLNISFNQAHINGHANEEDPVGEGFVDTLSKFIHFHDNLLHIDLSGMDFRPADAITILKEGIGKSRTLLSAHLSGLNLPKGQLDQVLEDTLKIKTKKSYNMVTVHQENLKAIFDDEKRILNQQDFYTEAIKKQQSKTK